MTATRDRIITATNELFRRQGYHGTSLSQISTASEATIGSIYHFFPGGKEAIAVAVIESTGAAYGELFELIVADAADPASAIETFFAAAADTLVETDYLDPCPIGTVAREAASVSEPLRQAADRVFTTWIETGRRNFERMGLTNDEARQLATLFVALVEGAFVLSRAQRSTGPLTDAADQLARLARTIPTAG